MSKSLEPTAVRVGTDYLFTVLASWLIPGAGHWLLGYRVRGALLGGLILGLFWMGQLLSCPPTNPEHAGGGPMAVSRKVSKIFFVCQMGNGFSTLLSNGLWGEPRYPESHKYQIDRHLPRLLNLAVLFTCVSGLINYLLILHVLDPRTWLESREVAVAASGGEIPHGKGSS